MVGDNSRKIRVRRFCRRHAITLHWTSAFALRPVGLPETATWLLHMLPIPNFESMYAMAIVPARPGRFRLAASGFAHRPQTSRADGENSRRFHRLEALGGSTLGNLTVTHPWKNGGKQRWKTTRVAGNLRNAWVPTSLHTGGVTGSIPVAPTSFRRQNR
jgi:hypothetical protein